MSTLPRNVILDLLPAYIAGEASAETRALVDEFAQTDPQVARLIQSGGPDLSALKSEETPHAAMEKSSMLRMRRRIRLQGWYLGLAISCTLTAISFQWDDTTGFHWTMQEHPQLSYLLGLAALVLWVVYIQSRARLKARV